MAIWIFSMTVCLFGVFSVFVKDVRFSIFFHWISALLLGGVFFLFKFELLGLIQVMFSTFFSLLVYFHSRSEGVQRVYGKQNKMIVFFSLTFSLVFGAIGVLFFNQTEPPPSVVPAGGFNVESMQSELLNQQFLSLVVLACAFLLVAIISGVVFRLRRNS